MISFPSFLVLTITKQEVDQVRKWINGTFRRPFAKLGGAKKLFCYKFMYILLRIGGGSAT